MDNIILLTDSYKATHANQYPKGTTNVYSYFESRGGQYSEVVFFGLQYLMGQYLTRRVTTKDVEEAADFYRQHFGSDKLFNRAGWEYIVEKLDGKLPVSIRAVKEGTVVPYKNVLLTVEVTDPNCWWLTSHLETLLVQLWYPCTVATQSREMKKLIAKALEDTGTPDLIDFKLHDFGFRGVSSVESAAIGGAAHLVNFMGSDTIAGITMANKFYAANMSGFSIPAAEHSTITSWGRESEVMAYSNMLDQFPNGLVAVVSDSYDIFNACSNIWGGLLKDKVLNRAGTLVVRPDSGEPHLIVTKVLRLLGEKFGYTVNAKGYKVLPDQVRVIQGDGVDYDELKRILYCMKSEGWSADNVAFGCGGGLLQKMNRDTNRFAFKCSSITVDGVERDVFKNPVTDPGKVSKKGRLKLVKHGQAWQDNKISGYATEPQSEPGQDEMVEVYRNGEILEKTTLAEVRERAKL